MSEVIKNSTQAIDKTTRNRIYNSRYWKEQCFALNAETLIDKALKIRCIGGLYSGSKRPTKFLCLVFKMLQMNLQKDIVMEYLKARSYKYLNAMAIFYLRLTIKNHAEMYEFLQKFYVDNRKLLSRDNIGKYEIIYFDEFVEKLLTDEIYMGIALPFLPKRLALEVQGLIPERISALEMNEQNYDQNEGEREEEEPPQKYLMKEVPAENIDQQEDENQNEEDDQNQQ